MTNRDPFVPDFVSKLVDFHDCIKDYFSISNTEKLKNDLNKPYIDLVCYYDLKQLRDKARLNGVNYTDIFKVNPMEEKNYSEDIRMK